MRNRGAFTLVELLAVIVIASMVTAMGAVSIGSVMRQTKFQRTVAALGQIDARARLHARTGACQMLMNFNADSRQIVLAPRINDPVDAVVQLSVVNIPVDLLLRIEAPAQETRTIRFDRLGTSDDYAVELTDGTIARRLEFAGLTGDVRILEVSP